MTAANTPIVVDFAALLLDVLGHTDGEFTSIGHDADGEFRCATMPPGEAPRYVAALPDTANIYFGVNPVRQMPAGRRGTEADITRQAALWADIDVKPGACTNLDVAHAIIAEVGIILGTKPSVIVKSGHGLHPYWPVSDGHVVDGDITAVRALARRFRRLVELVAENHHAAVDPVFDVSHMMRVPGTYNCKGA